MSFLIDTKKRSGEIELMDDFSLEGLQLRDTLDKIENINKWLGGNKLTLNGLDKLMKGRVGEQPLTLVDLGCGAGQMLRNVAVYAKKKGYKYKLIGIDANKDTVEYARLKSSNYPEISFLHMDIFSDQFENLEFDLVLSTLFMHHFNQNQILSMLRLIINKVSLGIVINDLHRHAIAYYFFRFLAPVFKNKMVRDDGLTSILRGFKRSELENMAGQLACRSKISWKWAFRYQWIITK